MIKSVLIADYMGYADESGKPVGHIMKVLEESSYLVSEKIEVNYALTSNYTSYFQNVTNSVYFHINVSKKSYYSYDRVILQYKQYCSSFK